jgi:hypothetical protein
MPLKFCLATVKTKQKLHPHICKSLSVTGPAWMKAESGLYNEISKLYGI